MDMTINSKNYLFFNALGSETRLNIIEHLIDGSKNITELAEILDVSSANIRKHINILEEANIIETTTVSATRGSQKLCKLKLTNYNLYFDLNPKKSEDILEFNIPIGHYKDYSVEATCGISTKKEIIGICDDPRYFSHPDRLSANILWFSSGWIEYIIPSYLFQNKKLKSLEISLELCSEAPGINEDYLSDIYFEINNIKIAKYTSPGDFGKRKGNFSPKWWYLSEYGLLKTILINDKGTFIDNKLVSDVVINDLNIVNKFDTTFKIISPNNTENPGGVNIFGSEMGDYNQDILIKLKY